MTSDLLLDLAAVVSLLLGAFLSLAAGVGLVRFPDALSRLHAATKPQVLGLIFVVAAIALEARSWSTLLALTPVLLFQVLTAPISAHMVGRAGYRTGNFRKELMLVDELEDAVDRATRESERTAGDADSDSDSGR
ncbi:MAG: Na+/H+ antiporter subunit [Microbacteriaceae bacterium]|jgi:multicomponent Na+:H+ antiporter subunit G|nr:Na+/H+ antiporter subunit [Microbacteriaceae bacterium]HEV7956806.1 monovalent cation/H(+) antiporter subunit G [Marisediminicola sp.]